MCFSSGVAESDVRDDIEVAASFDEFVLVSVDHLLSLDPVSESISDVKVEKFPVSAGRIALAAL